MLSFSIFRALPDDVIKVEPCHSLLSESVFSTKVSEKLAALNIHGELSVSLLFGLVKGSGSVNYVDEKVNTSEAVQYSLIQKVRTVNKSININDAKLKKLIAPNINFDGTHVVVGISKGANYALTMNFEKCNNESKSDLKGKLKVLMNKLSVFKVEGNAEGTYNEKDKELASNLTFKVDADMLPTGNEAPTTLEEAMKLIKSAAQNLAETNNKEGNQLVFHLLPIATVKEIFGLQTAVDRVSKEIESDAIKRLEQLFDDINETSARFQSLANLIEGNRAYICDDDEKQICNQRRQFEAAVALWRNSMGELLVKVRSGEAQACEIETLRSNFEEDPLTSPTKNMDYTDSKIKHFKEKIEFVKKCVEKDFTFITMESIFKEKRSQNKNVFILFISFNKDRLLPKFYETQIFFSTLKNNHGGNEFAVVDTDILQNIDQNVGDGIRVVQYYNGRLIHDDYLKYQEKLDLLCLARCDDITPYNGGIVNYDQMKLKSVPINFHCPKSTGCVPFARSHENWVCPKCQELLEYGFDKNLYCRCGFSEAKNFAFKCCGPMHGKDYVKFSEEVLENLIKTLKPLPEVNILVIGETGVGKSTLINALANYVTHETLDDAVKNGVLHLIPTQFVVASNGNAIAETIRVGSSSNESFIKGQSSTQNPKDYAFRHDNILVHLIDTPGIGDTRGIEQDKANMKSIMDFLSQPQYKKIHGICILIKPMESYLEKNKHSFEYCLKELLAQFHRSALHNIVFC